MKSITRKNFLIGSMAVAAMGARRMFAAAPGTVSGKARLKVGVLSDIHVSNANNQAIFIKALEWYRGKGVDAVVVAGDMADHGLVWQLNLVADAWFKVFPNNKTPDGKPVAQLFEYGNHCVARWKEKNFKTPEERAKNLVVCNPKAAWENAFKEEYSPVFMKSVNGYQFVGAHWTGLAMRGEWFKAHGKEIDLSLPFFYFQHPHPKDTCYGAWAWGHDDGTSTRILNAYGNAIALSGHSHYPLTDERGVWQGAFTSIGTSSLSYSSNEYNFRDNGSKNQFGTLDWRATQMKKLPTHEGKQGMLFTVCDDHIRIERHEFVYGQSLGDDWILPVGKGAAKPFEFAKRKASRVAAEFPNGAAAKVELVKPEPPKVAKKAEPPKDGAPAEPPKPLPPKHVNVTFPAAETRGKCRVFDYEVRAVAIADDVEFPVATRRVLARDYHLPQAKAGLDGNCVFALSELPKKRTIRFDVTPLECFGKRGATVSAPLFTTP